MDQRGTDIGDLTSHLRRQGNEHIRLDYVKEYLTGHIDILQIRYHKIYILDYKPTPVNKHQTTSQLKLYRKALSKRTQIPEHKFKLAYFNDKGYYEID